MTSLAGKVTLITGASGGIGAAVAKKFAALGSSLCLTGRDVASLERVAEACSSAPQIETVPGDLTKDSDRETLVRATLDRFGKLDVLINNAGIVRFSGVGELSHVDFDDCFEINVKSHVFLTKLAISHLKKSKGCIVNTSSLVATQAIPQIGVVAMTKAALKMYTECLALDLAPFRIRVNAINPTFTDETKILRHVEQVPDENDYKQFLEAAKACHPLLRTALPQDCAEAVAFLASDAAGFITGQEIYVDGGRHCQAAPFPGIAK